LLADHYGMDAKQLESQYKNHLSHFKNWEQRSHAQEWILFEKNIGPYVGLDETALSSGELYTILINKDAKGKKGTIIAMVKGTSAEKVSQVLLKLSRRRRFQVREITLDMAPNMAQIARVCFPAAKQVIDRFHVQKLAFEAVQEMRIKARWEALDKEMVELTYAKTS
ncbi:ISL3 family transposase, partial [Bacteroides fragilis]